MPHTLRDHIGNETCQYAPTQPVRIHTDTIMACAATVTAIACPTVRPSPRRAAAPDHPETFTPVVTQNPTYDQ